MSKKDKTVTFPIYGKLEPSPIDKAVREIYDRKIEEALRGALRPASPDWWAEPWGEPDKPAVPTKTHCVACGCLTTSSPTCKKKICRAEYEAANTITVHGQSDFGRLTVGTFRCPHCKGHVTLAVPTGGVLADMAWMHMETHP